MGYDVLKKETRPVLFLYCLFLSNIVLFCLSEATHEVSNEWAVEISGGDLVAEEIAKLNGFINHGKIIQDENFYLFSHPKLKKRSIEVNVDHHNNLLSHKNVKWAEQQRIKQRVKRDIYDPHKEPNDPMWSQMWYLLPTTHPNMHVKEAWEAGYTGKNVSVTILDDGIERTHPDLMANYDPLASGDINSHDSDPSPRLNPTNENRHGTRCAGEVAAVANNGICSIGIAYNSKIGGVRMLDGQVTDAVEAASIGFNPEHVDIYSASWGPDDDGKTVDGPAKLARLAFVNGVTKGRHGKGSIFVWASGNGGRHEDNCNCDGYTDSIYTLSISSATQQRTKPWYSESCSSTLASTYSSGFQSDKQIVTTDLRHGCTQTHTGTSASAPLAAAICALALEANPSLTWRDMQHLVVQTARSDGLEANDWVVNGAKRKVSHAFGYGMMDAHAMVVKAKNWTLAPDQRRCSMSVVSSDHTPRVFSSGQRMKISVRFLACDDNTQMIDRLEHVQAVLTLHSERRGDLEISLTSPMGTRSQLLGFRRQDYTSKGFDEWAFMTTHSWDENPIGNWTLEIFDRNSRSVTGTLSLYNLTLYGTKHSDWSGGDMKSHRNYPRKKSDDVLDVATVDVPSQQKPDTAHHEIPADPNCRVSLSSNKGCLVCNQHYFLDYATKLCVTSCSSGHYQTQERVNEKGERQKITAPRKMSAENHFEVAEEETFEDEERFYNALSCRPCSPHCHHCAGPYPDDCVQCMIGAEQRRNKSDCILKSPPPAPPNSKSQMFYIFIIVVIISLVFFLILFFRSHFKSRFCCSSPKYSYKHLPSLDENIEYRDRDGDDDEVRSVTVKINGIADGHV